MLKEKICIYSTQRCDEHLRNDC